MSAGLKSLQISGGTNANDLATQLNLDCNKHQPAKVCDVMKANRGSGQMRGGDPEASGEEG